MRNKFYSAIQIVLLIILAYKSASEKIELSCSEEILHPSQDYPECFPEITCTLSTIYSVQDSAFNVDRVIAEYNCLIFHNSILHEIPKALFLTGKSNITIFYAENSNIIELNRTSLLNAPHLLEINLKGNKIRVLKDKIFYGAPNLEKLDLSYNEISEFSSDVFDKLKNLKVLHLSNNLITTIPFELFMPLTGIQHLNMRSNKLNIKFGIFPEYVVKLDLSYNYIDIHHKFKIFALLVSLTAVRIKVLSI